MRRALVLWSVAFLALFGAFVLTVTILNSTLYSAAGFVESYANTLARGDAAAAAQYPGVRVTGDASSALLVDAALAPITGVTTLADRDSGDGTHRVELEYTLGTAPLRGEYSVKSRPAFLGLFSRWEFAASPLSTVAVTTLHDDRFRVNGFDARVDPKAKDGTQDFLVFSPGYYEFDHRSTYLTADPVPVPVASPGTVTPVLVTVKASRTFVDQVRSTLTSYLDECATQRVMLPSGCPFGKSVDNRVIDSPKWSMSDYPAVSIIAGRATGTWVMPEAEASARLKVKIQSLFDGTVSTFDDEVPFTVAYLIDLVPGTDGANDRLSIEADYG